MKTKEEQNALKEKEVEAENKKPRKLTEEELEKVTGGREYVLTDAQIEQGGYFVGQADTIIYNEVKYYDQHQCTNINRIDMFIYKSSTGAVLLIPFFNYS